jgi:hypothetical protein
MARFGPDEFLPRGQPPITQVVPTATVLARDLECRRTLKSGQARTG